MSENDVIRLVTTCALSRITYVTPYLRLNTTDKLKLNTMIKRAYKQALHLPISTYNEKLDELGIHNTIDELIEVQRITQYERLANSTTGRHIYAP